MEAPDEESLLSPPGFLRLVAMTGVCLTSLQDWRQPHAGCRLHAEYCFYAKGYGRSD
jgi:hypothetical protein